VLRDKRGISTVLIVSLNTSLRRRKQTQHNLQSEPLLSKVPAMFVDGVDGTRIDFTKLSESGRISPAGLTSVWNQRTVGGEFLTPGSVGCFLSHRKAWKIAARSQKPVLVIEDDINFRDGFSEMFPLALSEIPRDFGLLYLADLVNNKYTRAIDWQSSGDYSYKLTGEYWGTFAYVITPEAARTLYDEAFPMEHQVDSYIMSVTKLFDVPVYRTKKNIVNTDNSKNRDSLVQTTVIDHMNDTPRNLFVISYAPTDINKDFAATYSYRYVPVVVDKATFENPFQIYAKCVKLVHSHGGLCLSSNIILWKDPSAILTAVSACLAHDKNRKLIPTFFYGTKGNQFTAELGHMGMFSQASMVWWEEMHRRHPMSVRILPYWYIDPFVKSYGPNIDSNKQLPSALHSALSLRTFYAGSAVGLQLPVLQPNIPKIVHIIWLSNEISTLKLSYLIRTMAQHPLWQFQLWTATRVEQLTSMKYLIRQSSDFRQISDLARYEIMFNEGGVYLDTDFYFFKSLDLLKLDFPLVCHEDGKQRMSISVSNGFFAFSRRHPIMSAALDMLKDARLNGKFIVRQTGPGFFSRVLRPVFESLNILDSYMFYPVRYEQRSDLEKYRCYWTNCAGRFPRSIAMHLWGLSSHEHEKTNTKVLENLIKKHNDWQHRLLLGA